MTRYGSIYKITNLVNGKIYVGQTTQILSKRWNQHTKRTGRGATLMARAIAKYGRRSFKIEEIAIAFDRTALDQAEIRIIAELNSLAPNGYNLGSGGLGQKHHDSTRKQMSEAQKKRNQDPNERKKHGHVYSEEEKRLRSEQYKALGIKVKHTPESRAKIAAAKRGKPSGKARLIIDQNGTVYRSMTEAAEKTKNDVSAVSMVVNGKRKQANGYIFSYFKQAS